MLGPVGPKALTLGVRHHSVRKWKYMMRFEIRYFFLKKKVFNFKPHYILSLSTGLPAQLYSHVTELIIIQVLIYFRYCQATK